MTDTQVETEARSGTLWTPGPWWLAGKGTVRCGGKWQKSEGWIADVNRHNRDANARLIAAAPDLYDQNDSTIVDLGFLRRAIEEGDPKAELLIRIDDMVKRIRVALARARGEQS